MASISAPRFSSPSSSPANPNPNTKFVCNNNTRFFLYPPSRHSFPRFSKTAVPGTRFSESLPCRCQNQRSDAVPPWDGSGTPRRWDSMLQDAVKVAVKRWEDYVSSFRNSEVKGTAPVGRVAEREGKVREVEEGKVAVDWDWERWKRHFEEVEEQERIVSVLRSQLSDAVHREDYKDAARIQRAIVAAMANDTVNSAVKHLNKAIEEEHYHDAAIIRDHAGTGLVGWWAGTSEDSTDPYGRIIRITAEHGRYVARSYSSRQLASGRSGFPLFEIYFTVGVDGEYKQQATYLKRNSENLGTFPKKSSKPSNIENSGAVNGTSEGKKELSAKDVDAEDSDDDSDTADGLDGIQNVLQDMIPGVKVKVLKVIAPGKVDRDLISKVIEKIIEEEEDDDKDIELESLEPEDGLKSESDSEEIEVHTGDATIDTTEEQSEMSVNFFISGIMQNMSVDVPSKEVIRVPAKLEKRGRFSFSFSIIKDETQHELDGKGKDLPGKGTTRPTLRSADLIMSDLAKVIVSRKKIPLKVLKDVGELINLSVNQDRNPKPLQGTMLFNRIDIPVTSDPLSGLYISARGMFSSEVLYLRHRFGQWQEDGGSEEPVNLEFYEYVEALKLTGDPSVPAGQVAFRAKVGRRNQLPHKGIIPEEFGVVARYKGQGRLAEPGFRNPRWVDGELVILDGKYIRGGPVIGFVYWAPEYHFLMFFNRLRLQD